VSELRRQVGFWKAVHDLRVGALVASPEFLVAVVVGAAGGVWLIGRTELTERLAVVGDYLFIVGPLVGVVVAALALVITLLSASYLRTLRGDEPLGIVPFMQPFILVLGIQTATVVGCVAYRAAAPGLGSRAEHIFFAILSFFFVFATFEVVALARNLIAHGVTRSVEAEVEENEDNVRRLRGKHPGL
jgi:hypothetical protein